MTSSIRQVFGKTLARLAMRKKNLYVVNMDLESSLFLDEFKIRFPKRFIQTGVAESNAAAIAAGIAKAGNIVFLTSFSCFSPAINWAVIKQSICLNNSNVKIVGSHSGLMSENLGSTHQMLEDIALMNCLPNMDVFAPIDSVETVKIISVSACSKKPAYIRLVRPATPVIYDKKYPFTIGKSIKIRSGKNLTIAGHGPILAIMTEFLDTHFKDSKLSFDVLNFSSLKPFDHQTLKKSLKKTHRLLVIEDHQKTGGLGSIISQYLISERLNPAYAHLAVDNTFGQSGTYRELYNFYGLSPNNLLFAIEKLLNAKI